MQACVRISDGLIVQTGQGLAPDASWTVVELSAAQYTDYQAKVLASGGSGVTYAAGVLTARAVPVPAAPPPAPTVAVAPNAGSGATVAVLAGSNDVLGAARITAGTTPAAGIVATLTFGTPLGAAPLVVQVGAMNVRAGTLTALNVTANGFSIDTTATPVAGTTYYVWWRLPS